jgi:hypothetical protein
MSVGVLDVEATWGVCDRWAAAIDRSFAPYVRQGTFDYIHPPRLQTATLPKFVRPFRAPVAYLDWGPHDAPVVLCVGGIANTARRFDFLADALRARYRVIAMDWLGRGNSGWLPEQTDYSLETAVEQLGQALDALRLRRVVLVGAFRARSGGLPGHRPQRCRAVPAARPTRPSGRDAGAPLRFPHASGVAAARRRGAQE